MGQTITVTTTQGLRPEVRFFSANRSITGMATERYASAEVGSTGTRPPDVLARRLFELGALSVTVYSNVVTVETEASQWAELEPKVVAAIEHLFNFYGDGAGWSVAALAPYGIERLPSPVK
jgi:hypothetical protein